FFFQAEDGIRDATVTGVQTCALPISLDVVLLSLLSALGLGSSFTGGATIGLGNLIGEDLCRHGTLQSLMGLAVSARQLVDAHAQIGRASCRERVEVGGV